MTEEIKQEVKQEAPVETKEETPVNPTSIKTLTDTTSSVLDKAEAVAEKMRKENDRSEELLKRNEAVLSRMMLGGRTQGSAINKTPEQVKQEKIDEEVEKAIRRFR